MDARPPREMHLLEYWHILRKRRWVVLTALAVLFTTVTIGSFLITPVYQAAAVIQIARDNPNIVNFREMYSPDNSYLAYSDFYQTQYKLIESRDVLRNVAQRLDLPNHPTMLAAQEPGLLDRGKSWLRSLLPSDPQEPAMDTDPMQPWIEVVRGSLSVNPMKNTHLVQISFASTDPRLAADAANAIADEYILFNSQIKSRTTGMAGRKLGDEIDSLAADIDELDQQVRDLRAEKSILELGNQKPLELSALEELIRATSQARIQRARSQARYEAVRDASPENLSEVLASPVIKDHKNRLAELEREYAEKGELFKDEYPDMIALRSQIDTVGRQLEEETLRIRGQVVGGAETAFQAALGEENRLMVMEDSQKVEVRAMESNLAEYESLKASLDAKKEMRAGLIKRRDETGVLNRMEETQAGNIQLVEAALVPRAPFKPNKRLNIMLSLLVGAGLGVGLAFFFEYLDNSVKNGEELEIHTGVPALGLVPTMRHRGAGKVVALDAHGKAVSIEMITHQLPKSTHAEAYRDLRTTLLLSSPDHPPKLLMITSAQPREGKTSTAVNVAISLAQIGRRVLLVDADLRKPRLHQALSIDRKRGLSTTLAGHAPWLDMVTETPVPHLSVISSGPIPPNPAEMLASHSFKRFLEELRTGSQFDHVVIDTPPVLAVADPVIVGEQTDGVLLVVHGGATARQNVSTAVEKLRAGKARILGAVLNNMDLHGQGYGYYQYRYGRGEGYYTHAAADLIADDDQSATPGRRTGGQA